ncbi:MAG: DEAD/DEAH box helicase [Bifidobacteriaceae bacterium]|jgi:superfamily II DNA or RNA helicase|nr:DEAD/DEAH box helicase [Bifidobacteriaceae bacterium]
MPLSGLPLVDAVDLKRQVGALTFARGHEYFRRGLVLTRTISYDPIDLRLYGRVRGTRPTPYECRIWLEADGDGFVVEADSGLCTCPVGFDCKHIVALVLAANSAAMRDQTNQLEVPRWELQLRKLANAISAGTTLPKLAPVALQLRAVEWAGRYSGRPTVEARIARPGKNKRWVGHPDLRWSTDAWRDAGVSRAQARWFQDFNRLANPGYGSSTWLQLSLTDSDALWPHLARAADLGIELIGDKPGDTVELASIVEPAIDLRQDDHGLRLAEVVRIGGASGETLTGATVATIGSTGYAVFIEPRADQASGQTAGKGGGRRIVLGPGDGRGAVVGAAFKSALPLAIPANQTDGFWKDLYPVLANALPVLSTDGSVEPPELPAARLTLRIDRPSPTKAKLTWLWRYGHGADAHQYPTDSAERPGPRCDPAGEEAILARVEAVRAASSQAFGDPRLASTEQLSDAVLAGFAITALPALRQVEGLTITGDLDHIRVRTEEPTVRIKAQDAGDGDWFDLNVTVQVGDVDLVFADIFEALAADEPHAMAKDGSLVSLDHPLFQKLARLIGEAAKLSDRPGKPRIGRYQASLWQDLEEAAGSIEGAERWRAAMAELRGLADAAPSAEPLPKAVTANLRPYQKAGYDWLTFVWRHKLGGVLADDMGLGKTVQALAMMARARSEQPAGTPPFLVVAPSSVVPGWLEEAARFTPDLVVRPASETRARAGVPLTELAAGADLIVTSYAIFRLDKDQFAEIAWPGLILDEAQFAKNFATKVNQQARALHTDFKLAITGTPMENSLEEFWAIFAIVAPGLLGSRKQFKEVYGGPIAAGGDGGRDAMAQLRRRAKPLLLRRTKEKVAADLPERQEQVLHVELAGRHRELYDTYLQRERSRMLGLLEDWDANRFAILRSLTMLRRAALDVTLVDPALQSVPSSKLDVLMDQLDQVIGANHRALVFSQFTTYLAKVRARLRESGIEHSYLDGSTQNRADVINGFKTGAAPVFLISLKAGGFGLNLTEADYVFLLDPWWNPATENQAIDRTHRIGQTRPVLVSRLVSQDTIEEKVMALKERKQALFDSLLDQDGAFSTGLTPEDVAALVN